MDAIFEQIQINENSSFIYRTHSVTPKDVIPYHQHHEWELSLLLSGSGQRMMGDIVESYSSPELILISPNVAHCWICDTNHNLCSNITIQFREESIKLLLMSIPELSTIQTIFDEDGICKIYYGTAMAQIAEIMKEMLQQNNFDRFMSFVQILKILSLAKENKVITISNRTNTIPKGKQRIEKVIRYIMLHYQEKITINKISAIASLSPTAFCSFFKRNTRTSFSAFINEYRIGVASQLLSTTNKCIADICFESGFNDVPHFNRTFKKVKGITPTSFRNQCAIRTTTKE